MKQITKNLYQISLGVVNAFVVEDNGLTLIDTGLKGSTEKIFSEIKKSGKNPNDIKRIILTHCHADHTGSAADLKKILNVPVFAHEIDAALIEQGIASRPLHLTPGVVNWLVYKLLIKTETTMAPVTIEEKLKDNDVIPVAGGIRVIHTPGHSEGHIALLLKDQGVLIAADLCAHTISIDYSTLYEDIELGRKSILKAAAFSFDQSVFGHGSVFKGNADEKMKKKFSKPL